MRRIAAVDPGITGAVAVLQDGRVVEVQDMPVVDGKVSAHGFAALISIIGPVDMVVIERQQAMPKQGVSSTHAAGVGYGILLGVLAALERPVLLVAPTVWTRALGVGSDKEKHRAEAMNRWPHLSDQLARRKDHGRADACLLALWGWRHEMHGKEAA